MNGRNAPLSPVSVGDSDWPSSGYPADKGELFAKSRGQLISPPHSGGSISGISMNGASFPSGPTGGPSPPPSVGRSSAGTNLYARSESGRSQREESTEAILGEHYVALKRFLSQTSRDGKPAAPANKARDKLQRLTSVQFLELSTDVYDELVRRQAFARRPRNLPPGAGPPSYLLPEDSFHPKRNQARQKLASLGPPRFRDLATDVFCELERRYPGFSAGDIPRMGSPASMRIPSRSGTPVNGMGGFPPRGQSRRRPSEAGSVRSMRSGMGLGPIPGGPGSVPPSPGFAPNNYDRLLQKQAQTNTIVPNKSTMLEEDEDAINEDAIISPLSVGTNSNNAAAANDEEKKAMQLEHEKRVNDYESQIKELQEKMGAMETDMKQKQEEFDTTLDAERSQSSAANLEKQEWSDTRRDLETRLADTQDRSEALQQEMDRMRNDHAAAERQLRSQIEELRQSLEESSNSRALSGGMGAADAELVRENAELQQQLRDQQEVTEEVRREAEQFLREMRILSEQSGSTWEKHTDMEKTIERLEAEVRDWRNRYARTKTQLRNMRATSMGLTIEDDAGRYVREKGFTTDSGLVKDVHVTKFQIAIDELLRRARVDEPEKAIESMKAVIVSVRQITKDIDDSHPEDESVAQIQSKLKTRVSATANNLITAAKNFAMAAGLSPVSLLDAAASHLVAAVVELLRTVKIRATPAGELEDDDDGTMTPIDSSASFFSPRSNGGQTTATTVSTSTTQSSLPPPPVFQGLGSLRDSVDSSAYSPISSPRESVDRYGAANGRRPVSKGATNGNYLGINKSLPSGPNDYGMGSRADRRTEDLKAFLDDQTTTLVQTIQNMVGSIRSEAPVEQVTGEINEIADIVGKVIAETEASGNGGQTLDKLVSCRQRLVEAGDRGEAMNGEANGMRKQDWRTWTTALPPIAFEIARETKELVKRVDRIVLGDSAEEFS